jgi:hypothetical protein
LDRIGLDRSTPKAPKGAAHSPHPVQGSLEQTSSVENHAASAKKEKAAVHSEIYDAYPRKVGKPQALKAIGRAIRDTGVTVPELLTITRRFAEAVSDWPASERQFIPHPATWFNGHRFLDGPAEWGKAEVTAQKENGAAHPYASDSYAAPISSASAPEGWLQAWSELYTFPPPPTWLDVPPANVTEVTRYLKQHAP